MNKKKVTAKAICLLAAFTFTTTGTFAASGMVLNIDGKQVEDSIKVIDGRQYILLDSLADNLEAVTVDRDNKSIEINSDTNRIAGVISKVSPSVVGIIGKLKESSSDYNEGADNMIFGTGVIYRSNGYIITNAHVVKDMDSIVVVLSNSKAYMARLKAIDDSLDLAVIKVDKGGLQPAVFGDISDVAVGQEVVAIGTPLSFNLRNSATKGIISGMNRSADGEYRFIQSDAAINGGNSGGPLVNMKGEVIGINSVKLIGFGVEGLNFSIPIDTVKYAVKHFEKFGKIRRPYLGVSFTDSITAKYGLPSTSEGITVKEIEEGSPAEQFDIETDDKLLSISGTNVNSVIDYNEEMLKYLPGDKATLKIIRDKELLSIEVVFGEKESDNE
ncbi:serine protease Do [Ruminiclostridium sufflavum DSM 19573]|uniref:Serine protease Do n=1 Tax=Ruminiclostridium sufflavum DSM 19573 TaxID=1121337 RepID=A0A318XLR6_9FIRM|nr:trypsin-like peptidase domain-containing protein [Ruminiclostridium sufflavum]PYG87447.1 serine protease Do [Ruminiclostridium sufflavum DSM 19573]